MTEINISEPETIAGVPPIIVSGMKMSMSGPEMIIRERAVILNGSHPELFWARRRESFERFAI